MKKLFFLAPLLIAVAFVFSACGDAPVNYEIKACTLSTFTAEDLDGNIIDESVYGNSKITMINVWGTYCNPCKEEVPALNALCAQYADADFQIIGIPIDRSHTSAADAKEVIAELGGVSYMNIKVSPTVKPLVDSVPTLPYTIFLNSEGYQIGDAYTGAKSQKEWKSIIDGMLKFVNSQS